jgi:hypothetical protein
VLGTFGAVKNLYAVTEDAAEQKLDDARELMFLNLGGNEQLSLDVLDIWSIGTSPKFYRGPVIEPAPLQSYGLDLHEIKKENWTTKGSS